MDLHTPIQAADKLYTRKARLLEKLGITTIFDLLFHLPFRYEDYTLISKIKDLQAGEQVTIHGEITQSKNEYLRGGRKLQKVTIQDATGALAITWFNQPFIPKIIHPGDTVSLSGTVDMFGKKLVMQSPEYEVLFGDSPPIHTGRLVPIYSETRGISSKWLRRQIYKLIQETSSQLQDFLPEEIQKKYNLPTMIEAIQTVHFPKTLDEAKIARERLAFDELFLMQLSALERKSRWKKKLKGNKFSITRYQKQIGTFWEQLPFILTSAQKRAVSDIFKDISSDTPMNRLLEGDVGSGKTVVATIAMYLASLNGFQSVFMAPTEILAQHHFSTILSLLSPFGVRVKLITSSTKRSKKQELRIKNTNLNPRFIIHDSEQSDILVGTHAVLSKSIVFENLGLVVIDEQQRFGVEQRAIIRNKGKNPHLLTMTATPIPRTIALTLYGDLDLSVLDEMPVGRKKIKTWLVPVEKRANAYRWIEKQIKETDSQAFIICPFIEESESMQTVKAATKEFEHLQKNVFGDLKLGLLHGKLSGKQKDQVLEAFRNKAFGILVTTPVVEVGIDIPNATIMMIEASERFGLAQLHQLRGRVGRGEQQSYCLLFTESKNDLTIKRLKGLERIYVGAELAELDLRLRGPGELYGTMQHGKKLLKIASFSDFALIEKTRKEAERLFPKLSEYPLLAEKLKILTVKEVSPD